MPFKLEQGKVVSIWLDGEAHEAKLEELGQYRVKAKIRKAKKGARWSKAAKEFTRKALWNMIRAVPA